MAQRYWLVKSEPETYAYADLEGEGGTVWDGVRNHAAAIHLKAMSEGEEVLFYHSGAVKAVVGIARVARTAFPDASDASGRFVAVGLSPVRRLDRPVSLSAMKDELALAGMVMLRQGRLSVSPVTEVEWRTILHMAER